MKPKLLIFSTFDWIFICITVLLSGLLLAIPFFNYNNQAILYMVQKKYDRAEQKWIQVLSKKPLISFYRMNLALNYLLNNQADKAIQEYRVTSNLVKQVKKTGKFKEQMVPRLRENDGLRGVEDHSRESGNPEKQQVSDRDLLDEYKKKVLFYSFFNSAVASTVKGEIKKALSFYQKALIVRPKSLEVKTNIELLMNENTSSKNKKDSSQEVDEKQKEKGEEKGDNKKEEGESKKGEESQGKNKKSDEDENNKEEDKSKGEEKKGGGSDSKKQKGSDKESSIDKKQQEAILKAILEGEKKIRERRNRSERGSSGIEKDW